jgi:hypothetical protein
MSKKIQCSKCKAISGDDWSQCEGSCPIPMSPHYNAEIYMSNLSDRHKAVLEKLSDPKEFDALFQLVFDNE